MKKKTKYYGFRSDAEVEDKRMARLKKAYKRRSVADLLLFLLQEADEKILSKDTASV